MEIIVLFYMGISYLIGWVIFSPFVRIEDLHEWSFARLEISDLLALFLSYSLFLAMATWTAPKHTFTVQVMVSVIAGVSLIAAIGLASGLYLLAKMKRTTPAKRMVLIGVVIPLGLTLTIAWAAFPLYALTRSASDAVLATLAIGMTTLVLRVMSSWICKEPTTQNSKFSIDNDLSRETR